MSSITAIVRDGRLDADLAALVWLLAEAGVPVHVAGEAAAERQSIAGALAPAAADAGTVTHGPGAALEDVIRQPVPIRPATGAVLVVRDGRVVAAHFHRPPLRDAGGHIRPQGPAVLATWDPTLGRWEHFAWGVIPELAAASGRKAGDLEIELGRRREYLEALVAGGVEAPDQVRAALSGFRLPRREQ